MPTYGDITDRTDAGLLVPDEISQAIIQAMPQQSAALTMFRQVQMSSKTTKMPVMSALPFAYWVNGDTGLKQTTGAAWGQKNLVAEEIAVIVPVPIAVQDDSTFDILEQVKPQLVEAFGIKIDQAVFFGTEKPASWTAPAIVPGAISAGNNVVSGTSTVDVADDVNSAMALVEDAGYDVNGFAARRRVRSLLRGLRDANGQPIYSPSLVAGSPTTLYGETLSYVSNGAWDDTAAELIAGDFSQAIIGIRQDIRFEVFTEGVISDAAGAVVLNLMQQDAVALRATMRVAYQVANPINRLQPTEADRWPFAVLQPAVVTP